MPAPYRTPRTVFEPTVTTLSSGLTLVVDRVPSVDSVALGIWVKAGSRDEPAGKAGVAHLVEHTSFRGTRKHTARSIAREFENIGAFTNAYTEKEETCYYARTLTDHVKRVLSMLAEVVLHPVFDPADVEKERSIIAEEIKSYEDESEEYIQDVGEQQLFGKHQFGTPIVGSVESVQQLTADDARSFHDRHYHAGAITVAASGNVEVGPFIDLVERTFADVSPRRKARRRSTPGSTPVTSKTLTHPSQQAHVLWHLRTTGIHAPERIPLHVLNVILGDGILSRLNYRVRETAGLAYSIYSQLQLFSDLGILSIYAGLDEGNLKRTEHMMMSELEKLARDGVKRTELARAKEQMRAAKIMSLESLSSRMNLMGKGIMDEGIPEDPYRMIEQMDALRLEEVNQIARQYCRPDLWNRLTLVPRGDI